MVLDIGEYSANAFTYRCEDGVSRSGGYGCHGADFNPFPLGRETTLLVRASDNRQQKQQQ